MKLFLKGEKCYKPSCPIEKRGTQPPGQHGHNTRRGKLIGYGEQELAQAGAYRVYANPAERLGSIYQLGLRGE